MNRQQLLAIMPSTESRIERWLQPLNHAMQRFDIATPARCAAFLAQIAHESAFLSRVTENLNYSPAGLLATFNTRSTIRFTDAAAQRYGRTAEHPADQRMIANIAYANRMGNGPVESGDGWRYRGRGPGQLTGKNNYAACGAALGIDLVASPDLLELPDIGAQAFGWYWHAGNPLGKSLNALADSGDIDAISRAVNGGSNGLAERTALYRQALQVLA